MGKYGGTSKEILKLEGFNEIGIPDHAAISNANVLKSFIDLVDLFNAIL